MSRKRQVTGQRVATVVLQVLSNADLLRGILRFLGCTKGWPKKLSLTCSLVHNAVSRTWQQATKNVDVDFLTDNGNGLSFIIIGSPLDRLLRPQYARYMSRIIRRLDSALNFNWVFLVGVTTSGEKLFSMQKRVLNYVSFSPRTLQCFAKKYQWVQRFLTILDIKLDKTDDLYLPYLSLHYFLSLWLLIRIQE